LQKLVGGKIFDSLSQSFLNGRNKTNGASMGTEDRTFLHRCTLASVEILADIFDPQVPLYEQKDQ